MALARRYEISPGRGFQNQQCPRTGNTDSRRWNYSRAGALEGRQQFAVPRTMGLDRSRTAWAGRREQKLFIHDGIFIFESWDDLLTIFHLPRSSRCWAVCCRIRGGKNTHAALLPRGAANIVSNSLWDDCMLIPRSRAGGKSEKNTN